MSCRLSGLLVERTEWEGKISEFQKTVDKLKEENIYQQEVVRVFFAMKISADSFYFPVEA